MSDPDLGSLSDQQLYDRFVATKVRLAEVYYRPRIYKRLFPEVMKLTAEINSRQPQIASVFRAGLRHENPWVRSGVVKFCIDEWREEALAALKEVADMQYHPAGPPAGISYDHYTRPGGVGEGTRELVNKILDRAEASGVRLRGKQGKTP
jgi:hypothetical protein